MKTISQLIITMMICLFSIQAWAQSGKLFNTDNQLSSNLATQVFQDKSGFIWIATRNGLNNYDGYHINVIKKDMSIFWVSTATTSLALLKTRRNISC